MSRPLGALALAVFVVSACATEDRGVDLPESAWTKERVARLLNPPPRSDAIEELEEPDEVPLPRRKPEQEPAAEETAVDWDIDGLVGLGFDETQSLLGAPALDEVQPPARVWAYNGSGCVLTIFFYPHVDGSSFRALTYEVKGAEDSKDFRNKCFAELIKEKKGT